MTIREVVFWGCAAFVAYTYVIYPAATGVLANLRRRPARPSRIGSPTVSVVLAARDEEATIGGRVEEFAGRLVGLGLAGEIVVVSDGSTDRTAERVRDCESSGVAVRVIEVPENRGKAAALSLGCASARHEILVFADARQTWAPDALGRLLENFADPTVGAVSGELVLEAAPGVLAGVGLYWRFEKWLRRQESRVHSMVGATGAISAVRRELFRPIPMGTILDDVYWPLRVAMQGYRVVHDGRAVAYDRLPARVHDEFRRKVRTLAGNYQLVARLPSAVLPTRNPVWVAFLSHKLFRLAVPWALLGMLISVAMLPGPFYRTIGWVQAGCYAVALAGLGRGRASRSRSASAAASFLVLNAAAWLAFWVWASGRSSASWRKAAYAKAPLEGAAR